MIYNARQDTAVIYSTRQDWVIYESRQYTVIYNAREQFCYDRQRYSDKIE